MSGLEPLWGSPFYGIKSQVAQVSFTWGSAQFTAQFTAQGLDFLGLFT